MFDHTARQLQFTRSLALFSTRLEALLVRARLHQSQLPPDLLDEIAFTTGELMLVLTNHPSHEKEASVQEALAHARSLRERLRTEQPQGDQVTTDCDSFSQEIARLVIDSQKAA
jgi:hydroxypyruvate isomerase